MKFKKDDMVFYLPWSYPQAMGGDTMMYIMGFDEVRRRYKCFDLGVYSDSFQMILYCNEDELALVPEDSRFRRMEECRNCTNEEWFDELCYPVYECTGTHGMKEIREATHTYPSIQGWLRTQKPHSEGKEKKKFRKGRMVFYVPSLEDEGDKKVLYVINFDEETGKYKCFEPAISGQESRICYCLPEEIVPVPRGSALRKSPDLANLSKKKWFSEECHPIYYYHDGKEVFLREAWDTYESLRKLRKIKREWEKRREKEKK